MREKLRTTSQEVIYRAGRDIVALYSRLMFHPDVVRHAPLPKGPKILASNHPTTIDPFVMLTLTRERMSILITELAFNVPGFGQYLHLAGHIQVAREKGRAAFDQALRVLKARHTVGIFPEGAVGRLKDEDNKPRTGAVRLALNAGVPIVPIGVHMDDKRILYRPIGNEDFNDVARWYLRGPYAITVGQPMVFKGDVNDRDYVQDASENLMQRIGALAQESARRIPRTPKPKGLPAGITSPLANPE
ncbi:MAG: 1-acyl-sn-glycerol-3-phosphate acyltransferase [Anaerolineae bacterium]|nr:1-acyl-sn-glycerol-3-phosphate acyltransferase [Anaerolineae bacterium]